MGGILVSMDILKANKRQEAEDLDSVRFSGFTCNISAVTVDYNSYCKYCPDI